MDKTKEFVSLDSEQDDISQAEERIWDMKQELEDYLEEQGIYIRQ